MLCRRWQQREVNRVCKMGSSLLSGETVAQSLPFTVKSVCLGDKLVFSVSGARLTGPWGNLCRWQRGLHLPAPLPGLPVTRGVTVAACHRLTFLLWSPSCAFPQRVCILVLFQDLAAPARKRKASTSLTDDEGPSPGPFSIPCAVLELSSRGGVGHHSGWP